MEISSDIPVENASVASGTESSSMIAIDPAGDIVLEVGSDPTVSLLVSSKVLSVASDPFRDCFKPHLEELSSPWYGGRSTFT